MCSLVFVHHDNFTLYFTSLLQDTVSKETNISSLVRNTEDSKLGDSNATLGVNSTEFSDLEEVKLSALHVMFYSCMCAKFGKLGVQLLNRG